MLAELVAILGPQLVPDSEHLVDDGDGSVGAKRNRLLAKATGDYVAFVDDDDLVSTNYVADILASIEHNPDCVGMVGLLMRDGIIVGAFEHSIRYHAWEDRGPSAAPRWVRPPNHLNPVRRDLAIATGFLDINHGEDQDYSMRLAPMLNIEKMAPEVLYLYRNWGK